MRRGTAYWVNLGDVTPPELGKLRPGVIVSNTVQNERLDSVVVIPLSSRPPAIWPLRLELTMPGLKTSYAIVPGIRQVSRNRLHEPIGRLSERLLTGLMDALVLYLSD